MKKILFLSITLFTYCTCTFAQRYLDLQLTMISPVNNTTFSANSNFTAQYSIKNLGQDTIKTMDTIRIQWLLDGVAIPFVGGGITDTFMRFSNLIITPNDSFIITTPPIQTNFNFDFNFCIKTSLVTDTNYVQSLDTNIYNNKNCAFMKHIPLSTFNNFESNEIYIFPNPTTGRVTIKNIDYLNIQSINIIDFTGKQIKSYTSSFNEINLNDYNSGLYFIRINGTNFIKNIKINKI